ncbi:MAG: TIM-barrel domain-containing protein [Bacillota bacterium]
MEKIANGVWKIRFGQPEAHTPVSLRNTETLTGQLSKLACEGASPFSEKELVFKTTSKGVYIELPLTAKEHIYGFGLQLHRMDHTGRKKVMRVNSDPVADTGDSHAPVPFYVSTAGYGVFVDTSRYATFYCGTNLRKGASAHKKEEQKAIGTSEIELYGYQATEGDRSVIVDIPAAEGIDVYLFEGPDMVKAVQRYNLFSGGGVLPPMWGLGMWYRAYSAAKSEDVMRLAEGFREDGMPVDVFGFEPGWQTKAYSCSFLWDEGRFPNYDKMRLVWHELPREPVGAPFRSPVIADVREAAALFRRLRGVGRTCSGLVHPSGKGRFRQSSLNGICGEGYLGL